MPTELNSGYMKSSYIGIKIIIIKGFKTLASIKKYNEYKELNYNY